MDLWKESVWQWFFQPYNLMKHINICNNYGIVKAAFFDKGILREQTKQNPYDIHAYQVKL